MVTPTHVVNGNTMAIQPIRGRDEVVYQENKEEIRFLNNKINKTLLG